MKPSIMASFNADVPFPQSIALIREAGFRNIALGGNLEHSRYDIPAGRNEAKQLITAAGIEIDAVHAPFPEGDRLFDLDEEKRLDSVEKCNRAVDAAKFLDAGVVVMHLMPYGLTRFDSPGRDIKSGMIARGMKSVDALAEYACSQGVRLALENGKNKEYDQVLELFLEEFKNKGETVGFCYDSGHEHIKGACFEMLEKYSHRLSCLHIHDNLGAEDEHMPPYEGSIKWDRFRDILRGLDYSGNLLLEVTSANSRYKDPAEFLMESRKRAQMLLGKFG